MGIITREIERSSRYFDGSPQPDWDLLTVVPEGRHNIYYYRDRDGGYHHTSVRRRASYNPYDVHIREENGITYAKVVNRKTGQAIRR